MAAERQTARTARAFRLARRRRSSFPRRRRSVVVEIDFDIVADVEIVVLLVVAIVEEALVVASAFVVVAADAVPSQLCRHRQFTKTIERARPTTSVFVSSKPDQQHQTSSKRKPQTLLFERESFVFDRHFWRVEDLLSNKNKTKCVF